MRPTDVIYEQSLACLRNPSSERTLALLNLDQALAMQFVALLSPGRFLATHPQDGTAMSPSDEADIRTPVPAQLEPHLRLYRRLWLATEDLEEAKAALDEILRARIPIPRRERPSPLLMSLTTALVVAYARPWIPSRGQSIAERSVPGSLLRTLTASQRALHDFLIDLRNKEVAHADAEVVDLHLRLLDDGESAILRTTREAFHRSDLKRIRRIIERLEAAIEGRCKELRTILPKDTWI